MTKCFEAMTRQMTIFSSFAQVSKPHESHKLQKRHPIYCRWYDNLLKEQFNDTKLFFQLKVLIPASRMFRGCLLIFVTTN